MIGTSRCPWVNRAGSTPDRHQTVPRGLPVTRHSALRLPASRRDGLQPLARRV